MPTEINQNVVKFRVLAESNASLQRELSEHFKGDAWDPGAVVALAAAHGLSFSKEELIAAFEQDDALSDFELELVAAAGVAPNCGTGNNV